MDLTNLTKKTASGEFEKLLTESNFTIPKVGEVVKATVLSISKNEVHLDITGFRTGVVRGQELCNESADYSELKPGDETEATVLEMENEKGEMELSFRFAGHKKIWDKLMELQKSGEIVIAAVMDANKGGLMINVNKIVGFLPVSQLAPEHYPRVPGGEKNKILEKLKTFVGLQLEVRVIDVGEEEEKLIVSEKAAWEEKQKNIISSYKVGDIISGTVSALADFGVFVKFSAPDESVSGGDNLSLEGLVHISELAWQRIDHPEDVVKVGQEIKAEIIGVEGSKIFLSMKKLVDDPWKKITEKYNVGDIVEGKVLKINPFGLFVELDPEIHGLAHISELSSKPIQSPTEVAQIGDTLKFKIISIEPVDHRLGLSLRGAKEKSPEKSEGESEKPTETPAEKPAEGKVEEKAEEKAEEVKEEKKEEAPKEEVKEEKAEEKKE